MADDDASIYRPPTNQEDKNMSRTFVATFTVVLDNPEATLEDVKDYLNDALLVDLDTEDTANSVEAVSAEVHVDGLVEVVADRNR